MSTKIILGKNEGGIVNTGDNTKNIIVNGSEINWDALNEEIKILKSSPDSSVKKFAYEVETVTKKEDKQGLLKILSNWIPCIADLISSSYYIIEIAKKLGI